MLADLTPEEIIEILALKPLDFEGGFFRRTYEGDKVFPGIHPVKQSYSVIYYLLDGDSYSRLHRLPEDEIFHFYGGDPVEMLLLKPEGRSEVVTLGLDLKAGMFPQLRVPAHTWQGCRLAEDGKVALLGTTMSPGFIIEDFERPMDLPGLIQSYPDAEEMIRSLY